jgi:hypothetical protein
MERSEHEVLAKVEYCDGGHGQGVDDLSDSQLRARAVALVGDRPDALDVVLRALTAPADPDEP